MLDEAYIDFSCVAASPRYHVDLSTEDGEIVDTDLSLTGQPRHVFPRKLFYNIPSENNA